MIDRIIEILSLPDKAIKISKLSKKLIYENAELDKREKDILVSEIESIKLIAMLNEYSLNIEKFINEDYNYTDIAVIHTVLKKPNRVQTIAKILHEAIPHPVILTLGFKENIIFSTAPKRLNKIEKGKVIIEEYNFSPWTSMDYPNEKVADFLNRLRINTLPYDNLYKFYMELDNRIYLTKAYSIVTEYPKAIKDMDKYKKIIKQIESIHSEIEIVSKQQKQERNFGRRMDLHIKIKELEKSIEELKNNLNEVV